MRQIAIAGGNSGGGAALAARLRARPESNVITFSRQQTGTDTTTDAPNFPAIEGPLHGLAYFPGSINLRPFRALTIDDFRHDYEVNLLGAVRTIQHYLPQLQQEPSSVVLFSTVAVESGMAFHASIAAAKGAVEGFARSLAAELAPTVRVNVIAPSLTDTPMAAGLLRTDKQREAGAARHPLTRLGSPEDLAAAAEFLLSGESSWITGQTLGVDGGLGATHRIS